VGAFATTDQNIDVDVPRYGDEELSDSTWLLLDKMEAALVALPCPKLLPSTNNVEKSSTPSSGNPNTPLSPGKYIVSSKLSFRYTPVGSTCRRKYNYV